MSVSLASICLVLSGSPTTWAALAAALIALAALYALRRVAPANRWRWQVALLATGLVVLVLGWVFRIRIIELIDARGEFDVRLEVWRELSRYLNLNPLPNKSRSSKSKGTSPRQKPPSRKIPKFFTSSPISRRASNKSFRTISNLKRFTPCKTPARTAG